MRRFTYWLAEPDRKEPMRTRTVMLTVAIVLSMWPLGANSLEPGGTFTDDNGNLHEGFIEAIAAENITAGCDADGPLYCPNAAVTRGQMASFLVSSFAVPSAAEDWFDDDTGDVHEAAINAVAGAGIALGKTGDDFGSDDAVTRGQMATFIANALADLPDNPPDHFTDVQDSVHEANINKLAAAEISFGCDASGLMFCPADTINRAQMASFLGRALGLEEIEVPPGWPTDGSILTETEALALFSIYFEPADITTALDVAKCESNLDPTAVNPSGLHGGLFQHAISAWDSRASGAGWEGASIFDPEANAAVSAWLVEIDGWGHWTCWNG